MLIIVAAGGLVVGIVGAIAFWSGLFSGGNGATTTNGGSGPVSRGPTAAEKKQAENAREDARKAIRAKKWGATAAHLARSRSLDPEHKDQAMLEVRFRIGRARDAYRDPVLLTRGEEKVVPTCYRAAVSIGGGRLAMIVQGEEVFTVDTVLVYRTRTDKTEYTRKIVLKAPSAGGPVSLRAVAFQKSSTSYVIGGNDGLIRLLSTRNGAERDNVRHAGAIVDLAFTSDGSMLVALNDDGSVVTYSLNPLARLEAIEAAPNATDLMALDPQGKWILLGGSEELRIHTFGSKKPDRTLKVGVENLTALAVSADGSFAAAGGMSGPEVPERVVVIDLKKGTVVASTEVNDRVTQLAFDPSGKLLMVWSDQTGVLKFLSVPWLDPVETFNTRLEQPTRFALSLDGLSLVAIGKGPREFSSRFEAYELWKGR